MLAIEHQISVKFYMFYCSMQDLVMLFHGSSTVSAFVKSAKPLNFFDKMSGHFPALFVTKKKKKNQETFDQMSGDYEICF